MFVLRHQFLVSSIRPRLSSTDALLLLVVSIWGSNFSVVKASLEQIPPLGFNALRLMVAGVVLVGAARWSGGHMPVRDEWPRLIAVGLVGHGGYRLFFVLGLARTSVTNSSLILGCLPVAVLLLNTLSRRRESVGGLQWAGVALALLGLSLVVGAGDVTRDTLFGDLLVIVAVWCWAWYTIGSRQLLLRHSPLQVTACTTLVGAACGIPAGVPSLIRLDWVAVSGWAWVAVGVSGALALSLAYVIWYVGVQRLGSARTAVYSNLVPVVAMTVATDGLREPIGWVKIVGAGLVLMALLLTRMERRVEPV